MPEIMPIAKIFTPYGGKVGIPRQPGLVKNESRVVFEKPYRDKNAVRGLEGYSHVWLIWGFSENVCTGFSPTVRPPRLGGNERVGVFATRSSFRPNSLGLSAVRLLRIETQGPDAPVLVVQGADMLSGTPVYDVKPYLPFADAIPEATGGFAAGVMEQNAEVVFACDTSEYNEVSYSVSAESVSAVYAACNFTGCEQSGNDIAFLIDDFSICIDLDAAHAVVDAW